ncbi:MAG: hypothetical protein V4447_04225 [Pseudomonadota bacterium]
MLLRLSTLLFTALIGTGIFVLPVGDAMAQQSKLTLEQLTKTIATLDQTYSAGAIESSAMSEQAIVEVSVAKGDVLKWYAQAEQTCYDKFFVTSCLNDIKLNRRDKLAILQRINVEAKAWQRKQRIDELDTKLQEKNSKK